MKESDVEMGDCEKMAVNPSEKTAWKEVFSYYRLWNKAELQRKIQDAGRKKQEQKWQEFLSIMEFGMMIKPNPSEQEHHQKIGTLNRYYQRIQRFEEWRLHHGKSDTGITP